MPGFPRAARMLHAAEFATTLRTRPATRGSFLVVNHTRSDDIDRARLGLIIPKRFLKKAVSRNAVKRVLRDTFRSKQSSLPAGNYAFRLYKSIKPLSLTALKALVHEECEILYKRLKSS